MYDAETHVLLRRTQLFYLRLFLRPQTHIAGIKMTLTPLTLNPAPVSEEMWKVHKHPALFSWTYSALVTVNCNGIYTFLHRDTEKRVNVAPLHQCRERRVRKTNLLIYVLYRDFDFQGGCSAVCRTWVYELFSLVMGSIDTMKYRYFRYSYQ